MSRTKSFFLVTSSSSNGDDSSGDIPYIKHAYADIIGIAEDFV